MSAKQKEFWIWSFDHMGQQVCAYSVQGIIAVNLPGPASHDQPCAVSDGPETADIHRPLYGHYGLLGHDERQAMDERKCKDPSYIQQTWAKPGADLQTALLPLCAAGVVLETLDDEYPPESLKWSMPAPVNIVIRMCYKFLL